MSTLSLVKATQDYVTKMISNIGGMKVLLLDKETVRRLLFGVAWCAASRTLKTVASSCFVARACRWAL